MLVQEQHGLMVEIIKITQITQVILLIAVQMYQKFLDIIKLVVILSFKIQIMVLVILQLTQHIII